MDSDQEILEDGSDLSRPFLDIPPPVSQTLQRDPIHDPKPLSSRTIRHYKKDGGCRFYQNALRSEIVQKGELTSFEEQTEHNRLFSYLS